MEIIGIKPIPFSCRRDISEGGVYGLKYLRSVAIAGRKLSGKRAIKCRSKEGKREREREGLDRRPSDDSPLSLCKYFVRNLFRAGPPPLDDGGVSGDDEDRFSGPRAAAGEASPAEAAASADRSGEAADGATGSTTAVAASASGGGEAEDGRGRERSSGCIWQSLLMSDGRSCFSSLGGRPPTAAGEKCEPLTLRPSRRRCKNHQ